METKVTGSTDGRDWSTPSTTYTTAKRHIRLLAIAVCIFSLLSVIVFLVAISNGKVPDLLSQLSESAYAILYSNSWKPVFQVGTFGLFIFCVFVVWYRFMKREEAHHQRMLRDQEIVANNEAERLRRAQGIEGERLRQDLRIEGLMKDLKVERARRLQDIELKHLEAHNPPEIPATSTSSHTAPLSHQVEHTSLSENSLE